jgi:hypothetical protein
MAKISVVDEALRYYPRETIEFFKLYDHSIIESLDGTVFTVVVWVYEDYSSLPIKSDGHTHPDYLWIVPGSHIKTGEPHSSLESQAHIDQRAIILDSLCRDGVVRGKEDRGILIPGRCKLMEIYVRNRRKNRPIGQKCSLLSRYSAGRSKRTLTISNLLRYLECDIYNLSIVPDSICEPPISEGCVCCKESFERKIYACPRCKVGYHPECVGEKCIICDMELTEDTCIHQYTEMEDFDSTLSRILRETSHGV